MHEAATQDNFFWASLDRDSSTYLNRLDTAFIQTTNMSPIVYNSINQLSLFLITARNILRISPHSFRIFLADSEAGDT
jgi:hypothetical protein